MKSLTHASTSMKGDTPSESRAAPHMKVLICNSKGCILFVLIFAFALIRLFAAYKTGQVKACLLVKGKYAMCEAFLLTI